MHSGLDFLVVASGPSEELGGLTLPRAGVVLSGNPALGDSYLHELVHAVLGPSQTSNYLLDEGMATWLGGARGRSYREMLGLLRRYQLDHAAVRLEDLLHGDFAPERGSAQAQTDALKATGAMFVNAVYRRRGTAGLVALNTAAGGEDATLEVIVREVRRFGNALTEVRVPNSDVIGIAIAPVVAQAVPRSLAMARVTLYDRACTGVVAPGSSTVAE